MEAGADMTGAWFVGGLFGLVVLCLLSLIGLRVLLPLWLRSQRRARTVNRSAPLARARSVKWQADAVRADHSFHASRPEAEAEASSGSERGSEADPTRGMVTFHENALQLRDAEHYERGMLDAYATLLRHGYLAEPLALRQKGRMQQALAETAGNRTKLLPGLSGGIVAKLAARLDEVPVGAPLEERRETPLAERELRPGVEFRAAP